jgi:amidase
MHPFVAETSLAPTASGVLDGLRFAVKDIFSIAGEVAGFGNPTWAATHPPAVNTSPAVAAVLAAGAELIARVHTDEMTYSLAGRNAHFGAVDNPRAPGRTTGGSSSGSAGAVAAGLVDFALGSDTGGSVRVPASYCGVFGIRPTHDVVSLEGACPLAPSFDTCGWFTRDAELLRRIGDVLLPADNRSLVPRKLWLPRDAVSRLRPDAQPEIEAKARELSARWELELVTAPLVDASDDLLHWAEIFRVHQAWEAWQEHGEWIRVHVPQFGTDVAERFRIASHITEAQFAEAQSGRQQRRERLHKALGDDTLLLLPPAPDIPPVLDAPAEEVQAARVRTLQLSSIASICGIPQISFPWIEREGAPLGLSLAGPAGVDRQLLDWLVESRMG